MQCQEAMYILLQAFCLSDLIPWIYLSLLALPAIAPGSVLPGSTGSELGVIWHIMGRLLVLPSPGQPPAQEALGMFPPDVITIVLIKLWHESESEVAQSCLTLYNPMDCSLPGSFVHGIFQARVLEWVAISFSKGSFQPWDQTQVSCIADRRFTI